MPRKRRWLSVELAPVVEQKLEVAADRGQRRPQLVRDERDELVLQPVELAQPLVLLREQVLRELGVGARRALAFEQAATLVGQLAHAGGSHLAAVG